ncbi:hypothetical protein K443DRAFT_13578 [Laccaria amethystina LaAM-08-1]|uniref:MYND-type domain-containing protein n=1 Tax=Laccaria amethystina LaAM-08-1 TaxID=1095629 RepID=A0A0C9X805_9AGAR|nr:hypothetical protein K443DRAFT_13578 [Laccaria amethystina LaAM-08-1]
MSTQMVLEIFRACSRPECLKIVSGKERRRCVGCKAKTYCSPACQESDWQQHRELCLKSSTFKSPPDNLPSASAWGYHVAPQLSALALKIVGLDKLAPLPAANRKEIWERQSQKFCLLVQLRIVDKPGRKGPVKRHEYISSEKYLIADLDLLRRRCTDNVLPNLARRHPAVLVAYLSEYSGNIVELQTQTFQCQQFMDNPTLLRVVGLEEKLLDAIRNK